VGGTGVGVGGTGVGVGGTGVGVGGLGVGVGGIGVGVGGSGVGVGARAQLIAPTMRAKTAMSKRTVFLPFFIIHLLSIKAPRRKGASLRGIWYYNVTLSGTLSEAVQAPDGAFTRGQAEGSGKLLSMAESILITLSLP